ncbi:MAG: PHP domain-containing protein, partial [Clostridiales bacterium]|nr:PHP domain-containing protein [Clostridiales bacterium]
MTYDELLQAVYKALPEAEGKIAIERVRYVKSENKAYFSFLSDVLIGEKGFFVIKTALEKAFPGLRFSLRVASPSLAKAFLQEPDKYAAPLNHFLIRHYPAAVSWEFDMRWTPGNGRVTLEMPDEFSYDFMKRQNVQEQLSQVIRDIFRLDTEVGLRVCGDEEKRLKALQQEREEQERVAAERAQRYEELAAQIQQEEKPRPRDPRIRGRAIADPPLPIIEIRDDSGLVVIRGKVLSAESREVGGGEMVLLSFLVTDYTSTIRCKIFLRYRPKPRKDEDPPPITDEQRDAVQKVVDAIRPGMGVLVRGDAQYDNFAHETGLMARDISACDLPKRTDDADQKRIELHLHTQMSNMDAVSSATALIQRAAEWGHEAIAITDHGVAQAFPEAFAAAKKYGVKLLPGIEGYLTDDDQVVMGENDLPLDTPIIVLDFETTGLNTAKDRIIEIGAVKMAHGQVVDSFGELVNPGMLLPEKITEITHITDQMLRDKPTAAELLPRLLAFMDGCPIAAHNAKFDCAVLESELKRLHLNYDAPQVDTLALARKLYPELKSHRLSSVCRHLGVSLKGAHRAVNDAAATAQCLARMMDDARKKGAARLDDLNHVSKDYTLGNSWHVVLLAQDQDGMTNLNHIISEAHLKYFRRRPHIPRAVLQKYRKGILVGSACAAGELYSALVDGAAEEKLGRIARFYDYLEIQPLGNNDFLLREGRVADEEALRENNRRIVRLGEKLGIPVCATGDVHFLDPQDKVFRAIIQAGQGYDDADLQPPLYFRTTGEMLEEFSYLGRDKAFEVVVTNPKKIADRIGKPALFPPHPEGKTTFSPFWPEAENDIKTLTYDTARRLYGDDLPDIVEKRIEKELNAIVGYGYCTLYSIAQKLVKKSLDDGYVVGSRGSVGSSFVAFLTGITEINSLPPHYRCTHCRRADFDIPPQYTIGVDLPDKNCPVCGQPLVKDGFDIPFEAFLGFKGDKVPDIDLN